MNPFFSVVIPTLNEEKYLPKLLGSLVKQTFRDFEIILVDGYSKDKTVAIFNKFKPSFPLGTVILSNKKNVGLQRNIGAKHARGSYFTFFDADVELTPTFLEEIHVAAIKKPFLLATTWMTADSKNPVDEMMVKIANFGWELSKSINKPLLAGFNIIIKREAFDRLHGFREDMPINEDGDLAERALKKNIELVILPEPKLAISLRRFRSEGTLQVLRKYTKVQVYTLLKGPITHELFEYQMGGHVHKLKKSQINKFIQQNKKNVKNIIRKFNELLS